MTDFAAAAGPTGPAEASARRAMIIANDAHVTYQVYASGKRVGTRDKLLSLDAIRGGRGLTSVPALRGVSFTAREGETIGIVGHNGSGKSTLFKAMSGLIPTSQGEIWARDRPVLLGVNAALVPELSGEDNIKLGLLAMGFTKAEAAAHVDEIADFAELNEFIHHPMRTYSSGMGARLRFAIASAKAHSILLIDEALAVGDRKFRVKSEERIRGLRDSAGLVMIVSHSVGSLKDSCERVLWIHKGELREDGPTDDVIDDYVRWTKDPKSVAVGAAAHRPAPVPPPPRADDGRGAAAPEPLTLETLFASSTPAEPVPVRRSTTADGARTVARRAQFRQASRARRRRRVLAVVWTVAVILLSIAAGAAVALLASAPTPRTEPAAESGPVAAAADVFGIGEFASGSEVIECPDETGTADVSLSWSVDSAARVAIGRGDEQIDALDAPMIGGLGPSGQGLIVPYPCEAEAQTYTLTAEGPDGDRLSAPLLVTRELGTPQESAPVVEEGETDTPDSPSTPRSPSRAEPPAVTPSAPAPAPTQGVETPAPEESTVPDPEPTEEPAPVEEPLPTELPSIPTPEPTSGGDTAG